MRRRINNYTINTSKNTITLDEAVTLEDIRLIIDETQMIVICSSMQKGSVTIKKDGEKTTITEPVSISTDGKTLSIKTDLCMLASSDKLTIEIDKGDKLSDVTEELKGTNTEATQTAILTAVQQAIKDAADMNKETYASVFVQNTDSDNSYTLVLPTVSKVDESTQTLTINA